MSAPRTYALELTADELCAIVLSRGSLASEGLSDKLYAAKAQAKADRERDELGLPWRVDSYLAARGVIYRVVRADGSLLAGDVTLEQAKLMSAAPELLEAVQASMTTRWWVEGCGPSDVRAVIERALRKVETGVPEDR